MACSEVKLGLLMVNFEQASIPLAPIMPIIMHVMYIMKCLSPVHAGMTQSAITPDMKPANDMRPEATCKLITGATTAFVVL